MIFHIPVPRDTTVYDLPTSSKSLPKFIAEVGHFCGQQGISVDTLSLNPDSLPGLIIDVTENEAFIIKMRFGELNVEKAKKEREEFLEKYSAQSAQQHQQHIDAETAKVEAHIGQPLTQEMKDKLRDYGVSIGFTKQELNEAYDARVVISLYDAAEAAGAL